MQINYAFKLCVMYMYHYQRFKARYKIIPETPIGTGQFMRNQTFA